MSDWTSRAHMLADELDTQGVLGPEWRAAFEGIPRHVFVPEFYTDEGRLLSGTDPMDRDAWLDAVYSDQSLVTKVMPVPGQAITWPISSSTRPGLMAHMLTLLNAESGQRVMEIGTGTGYNAALLSYRLGHQNVTSIDIDPDLASIARQRLQSLGYSPHLVAGDGAAGVPDRAPFDRVIATCAVPGVPVAWVNQLAERGVIVTDVRSDLASALAVLVKIGDRVQGKFLPTPGHFMWLRRQADNPLRDGGELVIHTDMTDTDETEVTLDPGMLNDPDLRFMLSLAMPDLDSIWQTDEDGVPVQTLRLHDQSWAQLELKASDSGRFRLIQGGSQRLWERIEQTAGEWERNGRPDRTRFGMTADAAGTQTFWLDSTEQVINTVPAA